MTESLPEANIAGLLRPFLKGAPSPDLVTAVSRYLELLLKWSAFTNLTAVRRPEEIITRHFGESFFTAENLPEGNTLLDLGSGAGFPGLPIQLMRPELRVTLAESQNKKAAFLREVVRQLGLDVEVFGGRAETMAASRRFDLVTLRAVDDPSRALRVARERVATPGCIVHLGGRAVDSDEGILIPGGGGRTLFFYRV